jgi:uncharacterized iron-regulated membrane protein
MAVHQQTTINTDQGALFNTIWRWHFYAGLFVLPFILILSVTGAIYLFKPQIDRWEEGSYRGLSVEKSVSPDAQLRAALTAYPDSRFNHYRLPEHPGDAAMLQLALPDGDLAEVYVSPQGKLLGTLYPDERISTVVSTIHGTLLLGKWGDWLVELAASWTIVMILTGLYMWWPRPFRAAGTFWPRLSLRGRVLLKDIHRVTGFWIAGLVLVMLASGLPWAGTWGGSLEWARNELGLIDGPQNWKTGSEGKTPHHAHEAMVSVPAPERIKSGLSLSTFVVKAHSEHLAFPALVLPPYAPQKFGPPTGDEWTVKSMAQNRPLMRSVTYDPETGAETARRGFGDQHVIDRVVNYGVAWHEGQLFGLANQLIGLTTAIALIAVSLLGVIMWWKRKPSGSIGAPAAKRLGARKKVLLIILGVLAMFLPMLLLSAIVILSFEFIVGFVRTRKYTS